MMIVRLLKPHDGQRRVIREALRFNVGACGRRFGKTALGVNLACEKALGGGYVGWFAPEYKLLLEAWRDVKSALAEVGKPNEQEKRIELKTGGVIEFWAFDRNPRAGRSRKYHRVVIDEAALTSALSEIWPRSIRPTLTDYGGDAWFLSSPVGRNYFRELYQRGQSPDHPDWASWRLPTWENPHMSMAEIEAARLDMTDEEWRQEYGAEFLDVTSGSWFPKFSEDMHVSESAEFDPRLPVHLGADPGVHTGAAWFQVADRGTGRPLIRVFADWYGYDLGAEQSAREILTVADERCGGRRDSFHMDPAGGVRTAVGVSVLAEYERAGLSGSDPWPTYPGSVADGLAILSALVSPAAGPPGLVIHPRCTRMISAFQDYRRKKVAGQWTDKPEDPQHPAEDMIDALRGPLLAKFPDGLRSTRHAARISPRAI